MQVELELNVNRELNGIICLIGKEDRNNGPKTKDCFDVCPDIVSPNLVSKAVPEGIIEFISWHENREEYCED